mgnify:CR=1 FL=1
MVVFDPTDRTRELGRFDFPRQEDREELSLADFFRPLENGAPSDVIALQVVTSGKVAEQFVAQRNTAGDYSEGYFLHGFSVQTAEGAAELACDVVHGRGDSLLLGTDLAKEPERLVRAYDDAKGVTAEFGPVGGASPAIEVTEDSPYLARAAEALAPFVAHPRFESVLVHLRERLTRPLLRG